VQERVLPTLKELHIPHCGLDSGYVDIIKACEAETITKLEFLNIDSNARILNQLIESLPKMKVKRLHSAYGFFARGDRAALMSAFYKNTSLVGIFWMDDESPGHVARILQRNRIMANIKNDLLGGISSPDLNTPLGRWNRVLA
jgi:hypothetical protein